MDEANEKIGIIVLAAGSSTRMNEPKQLLEFEGETLLRRAVKTAVESIFAPVVVVLGANFNKTKAQIENFPIEICFNENWRSGLSSSIIKGIEKLFEIEPHAAAVMITLADQPFIQPKHLNRFAEAFYESKNRIIAAEYENTIGVPALFAREIFGEFFKLTGDKGAKAIIKNRRENPATIHLPEAAPDIDTPQDFINLKTHEKFDK